VVLHLLQNYCVQFAGVTLSMDARMRERLRQLVGSGVRRLSEMRRHLQHYMTTDLFNGRPVPPMTDARYWPSNTSILNAMYYDTASCRFAHLN